MTTVAASKTNGSLELTLKVIKATHLYNADKAKLSKSDPYAIVSWKPARIQEYDAQKLKCAVRSKVVGKTEVVKSNLNPVWNAEFKFTVPAVETKIKIELFDKDTITSDDYLGQVVLPVWSHVFENDAPEEVWLQVYNSPHRNVSHKAQGAVKVEITAHSLPPRLLEEVTLLGMPAEADVEGFEEQLKSYLAQHPVIAQAFKSLSEEQKATSDGGEDTRSNLLWEKVFEGEKKFPVLRLPRIATTVQRSEDDENQWIPSNVLVGAKAKHFDHIPHSVDSEGKNELAVGKPENPWETPKVPPVKGTYDWNNWGDTIYIKVRKQWSPRNLIDIQNAIADAKKARATLRCVGHAHSWAPVFSDDGNDIMFMNKLVGLSKNLHGSPDRWTMTILAGTSTGALASFMKKNGVYLPTNVISTQFIWGGLLSTGSHGSGWHEGLVLDHVVQFQIVDSQGQLRKFNKYKNMDDWKEMDENWPYVALNLGMFGILYSITLKVERENQRALNKDWSVDYKKFWSNETRLYEKVIHENNFTELFWFPFNKRMWVKTWDFTDHKVKWRPFKAAWNTFEQWIQSRIGHHVNPLIASKDGSWPLPRDAFRSLTPAYSRASFGLLEAQIIGTEEKPLTHVSSIPDAIHWRKFLDAIPVWNTEFAIDLPRKEGSDKADLSAARDCWLFVTKLIEDLADGKTTIPGLDNRWPCNVTLEARFCADTCAVLGNSYGNYHTVFFEFVTGVFTPGWKEFSNHISEEILKKYPSARSHWGKYQQDFPGYIDLMRKRHGKVLDEWKAVREKLKVDPENMFTNSWFRSMFRLDEPYSNQE